MRLCAVVLLCLLSGCTALKNATYPDFYEVRFASGKSNPSGAFFCVREDRVVEGHRRSDVLECTPAEGMVNTLTGHATRPEVSL